MGRTRSPTSTNHYQKPGGPLTRSVGRERRGGDQRRTRLNRMDGLAADEQPIDLREYLATLKTRKWTVLLVLFLVVASALIFSYQQTPLYESTARLLVKGVPTDASGYVQPPNLETEAEIVASQPVASLVIDELRLDVTPATLIDRLRVQPAAEIAQVLQLSYTSPDPTIAAEVPNSFASKYIEYKRDQAQEALELGRQAVEEQLEPVQEQLADIARRLNSPEVQGNGALRITLENERSTLIARLGVLQQRVDDFETRQPIDLAGGEIIQSASVPTDAASPDHIKNGLLAGFLGLVLGIALAFLRERLDDRLRGRSEIERAVGAPVLATIPRVQVKKNTRELVTVTQPRSSASEAYRSLRTNLQFLMTQQSVRSILVTSPSAGEGKTMTSANLAMVLAQAGQRVILVSADLRRPTLESYFGVGSQEGLSSWLAEGGEEDIWRFIQDPGVANLRLIPSGPIPGNPAELLTSRRLRGLVDVLESSADLVLVDSPPSLAVADASILASHVDGVVLVLNAASTHRSAAARAREELERVGASLLGCVYNAHDASQSPYYYQPYYGSSTEDETGRAEKTRTLIRSNRRTRFGTTSAQG